MTDADLNNLGITPIDGKMFVNEFRDLDGLFITASITENKEDNTFRVSIRSKFVAIDKIATQFRGGGHANASGATLKSLDEVPALIAALDKAVIDYKASLTVKETTRNVCSQQFRNAVRWKKIIQRTYSNFQKANATE